jgi:hypothetical protein
MKHKWSLWLLIAGLALVFGYFGVDKFRNPLLWIGFLPAWTDGFLGIAKGAWLNVLGIIEIALALLIVIPKPLLRLIGSALITLHLLVVVLQVGWNDIGVRDLGLMLASAALFMLLWQECIPSLNIQKNAAAKMEVIV